ncbi:uncharacterized protein LOC144366505 [Ictidomys tridecemlineatus]
MKTEKDRQKHREETANEKGERSTNSCGAVPKPTESNLERSSDAEQKRLYDMDNTAHHQQKSDSEKHREVCAASVSSKFEPSIKKINEHGQGKSEIRKTTEEGGVKTEKGNFISLSSYKRENIKLMVVKRVDKGKDDTPFYYMAESHLGKSSHEEQRGLKCAGHSKQQNDSEQHQEMCAASESVEIYISTKEGISKLGKVCRDLYDSCKPMNKIEEKRVKLTMQTWNFNIEPHLDRSSNAEQKSFHDIDDTAHRQQKVGTCVNLNSWSFLFFLFFCFQTLN